MRYAIFGYSRKIKKNGRGCSPERNILIPSLNENCKFSIIIYCDTDTTVLESKMAMGYGLDINHTPWLFIFRHGFL